MDRERLTALLGDPGDVSRKDLAGLQDLAERFPWFSGAQLLWAVGENQAGDVLANDRSQSPAAHLPSRAVLFDLTRKDPPRPQAPMQVVRDTADLDVVSVMEKMGRTEASDAAHPAPPEPLPAVQDHAPLPFAPEPDTDPTETALIPDLADEGTATPGPVPEALPIPETEMLNPSAPDGADPLEQLYREAVANAPFILEPRPTSRAQDTLPPTAPPPLPPIVKPVPTEMPETPADPVAPARVADARLRFTDWLEQADTTNVALPEPRIESAPPVLSASPLVSEDLPGPEEIVERFIQRTSPAPIVNKAEFYSPQQAAKKSLLDAGLVSETLGWIHEKQGNYAKAMEVYSQLAKLDPRKSVYFAALSKALEGRMNK